MLGYDSLGESGRNCWLRYFSKKILSAFSGDIQCSLNTTRRTDGRSIKVFADSEGAVKLDVRFRLFWCVFMRYDTSQVIYISTVCLQSFG